jgi:hypothetical protein
VHKAGDALQPELSSDDFERVVASAEEMWRLWIGFFSELSHVFDAKNAVHQIRATA